MTLYAKTSYKNLLLVAGLKETFETYSKPNPEFVEPKWLKSSNLPRELEVQVNGLRFCFFDDGIATFSGTTRAFYPGYSFEEFAVLKTGQGIIDLIDHEVRRQQAMDKAWAELSVAAP